MLNINPLVSELEGMQGAKFISFTYTAKKTGEVARYTLAMGVNYAKVCEADILELELRLKDATGIEAIVLQGQIDSLKESIAAKNEGREHEAYTKAGVYRQVCPGVKLNINDGSLELCGFQHAKAVITPGVYKAVKHRSQETALKAEVRKSLKVGKFKTLCLDPGHAHTVKLNGETIEFN